jgi:hypothetical protein
MGKIEGNELNQIAREIIDKARAEAHLSRDGIMRELENYGMAHGTMRAVYYDQRLGTQPFVDELWAAVGRLIDGLPPEPSPEQRLEARDRHLRKEIRMLNDERRGYRAAIRAFCLSCANEESEAKAKCWNSSCELRSVSPLPLRSDAISARALDQADDL